MRREYALVDVFTLRPFGGNSLAVFTDGSGLDDATMQRIANELHHSETTFVLPPAQGGDRRLRIFTPLRELPFAGHPTVGTAWVLAAGRDAALTLELVVGPLRVTVRDGFVEMAQPLPEFGEVTVDRLEMARALSLEISDVVPGAPVQVVSSGVPFRFVRLRDRAAVERARPTASPLVDHAYVFTTDTVDPAAAVHGRMFGSGSSEDPATGSAQGPLGAYLVRNAIVAAAPEVRFRSEQGFLMGRPSILDVRLTMAESAITAVHVGGHVVPMGGGWIDLP